MLQMRLRQSPVTCASQLKRPNALRQGTFNAGANRTLILEIFGALPLARGW